MSDRRVLASAVVALAATLGLLAVVHQSPGRFYAGRAQDWNGDWMPPPDHAYAPGGKVTKLACHLGGAAPDALPAACVVRHDEARPSRTILVVGDSHAFSDWSMLSVAYGQGWDWAALSKDGCPLSVGAPDCVAYWHKVASYVAGTLTQGDVLYVSANWAGSKSDKGDFETLDRLAAAAAAQGAALVIKGSLPLIPRAAFLCTAERFRTDYTGCAVSRAHELARISKRETDLEAFARARPNVRLFEPFDTLCPGETCEAFRDGKPLFRDSRHLSAWASRSLGRDFVKVLDADQ